MFAWSPTAAGGLWPGQKLVSAILVFQVESGLGYSDVCSSCNGICKQVFKHILYMEVRSSQSVNVF